MASSVTQILGWLPGWGVVIGEWGSESAQALANRVTHAYAYSRDTTACWHGVLCGGTTGAYTHYSTEPLAIRPTDNCQLQSSRERKRVLRIQVSTQHRQSLTRIDYTVLVKVPLAEL